ncbi:MAG: DapH/DapD/GlmU-related protein, partial [Pseudomonadota bacterium]
MQRMRETKAGPDGGAGEDRPAAAGEVVLYGAGSPLIVDVEESCAAAGLRILAIIRNVEGPVHALRSDLVVPEEEADPALLTRPVLLPMFGPASRRAALAALSRRLGGRAPRGAVLADPHARIPASTRLEAGAYVNAGVVIGAAGRIGAWALINRGATLGHHCELAPFASVGPGAVCAGSTTIGEGAVIGAGAVIGPGVRVGAGAAVAPGAVLRKDLPDGAVAAAA